LIKLGESQFILAINKKNDDGDDGSGADKDGGNVTSMVA
jgi:hypothetical protein